MSSTLDSITPKSIATQPAVFDDFDIFLLAYEYPEVDLRHEIRQAELKARVNEFWQDTPFQDMEVLLNLETLPKLAKLSAQFQDDSFP